MRPTATAVVRAGLIPEETLVEMGRWGLPVELVAGPPTLNTVEDVLNVIRDALEGDDQVRMRDTDFDVLQRFLSPKYKQEGKIVLDDGTTKSSTKVFYCKTLMGLYAIPFRSETISELLTNGLTHLLVMNGAKHSKIFFDNVEDLYFGEHKAFILCHPRETSNGDA